MTVAECVAAAARDLVAAGFSTEEGRRDASLLARAVLGWTMETWLVRQHEPAPDDYWMRMAPLVGRRAAREPLAYLTGAREFYGRPFHVSRAVLIPRPETELLIEAALARLGPACEARNGPGPRIADIGTGSGCLGITLALECRSARVIATDISGAALSVARDNAAALGIADRMEFRLGPLLAGADAALDVIVSNPPYIRDSDRDVLPVEVRDYEPAGALFAGPDGLTVIREVVAIAGAALADGGWLLVEIGAGQSGDVRQIVNEHASLQLVEILPDLQGIPRVLVCQRPETAG